MTIKRSELKRKYNNMNNTDLALELGISIPTLLKLIDDSGIERKGSGNGAKQRKIKVV